MTSQQQADEELQRFRNPAESRSFFATNDLDSATDRLWEIMKMPDGPFHLRQEFLRIEPNVRKLNDLINELNTVVLEAAQ